MKKTAFLVFFCMITVLPAVTQVLEKLPFDLAETIINPVRPDIMAQGGSFAGIAHGYDSLFTNPAGFSRSGGSLTIFAPSVWLYSRPDRLPGDIAAFFGAGMEAFPDIIRTNTEEYRDGAGSRYAGGGFGVGSSAGIGFVGRGLGLGMTLTTDTWLSGSPFPLGLEGHARASLSFTGGFSIPFNLLGVRFHAGADARYFLQSLTPLDGTDALGIFAAAGDFDTVFERLRSWNGYGMAFDAGLIAEKGPFTFGLSVRDLFDTEVEYVENSLQEVFESLLQTAGLPPGTIDDSMTITQSLSLGIGFHPDLGAIRPFFDPALHAEFSDVTRAVDPEGSFLTRLHFGASVKLLSFLELMGGLNQGYITLGAGFKFLFLDVSAAVFTRELGDSAGERPGSGAVFEAAFRL